VRTSRGVGERREWRVRKGEGRGEAEELGAEGEKQPLFRGIRGKGV